MNERGILIAFEGLDGSGKSTQIEALARSLAGANIAAIRTREPTDGPMGRRIREMARSGEPVAPELELDWFMQDRAEHVAEVITPALEAGTWVLTDRYTLSTVAYQGARGLDAARILEDCERDFPIPDLVLYFRLPAREGLARVNARGGVAEPAFEQIDFLEKVALEFDRLSLPYLVAIDAMGSESEVRERMRKAVVDRLGCEAIA